MDEFFLRELIIFVVVTATFIGFVPLMIRGHHSDPIEAAASAADKIEYGEESAGRVRLSKKRRARERDAMKKASKKG